MFKRILVPVDGSATSNRALASAIAMARAFGGRLRLVHVVDEVTHLAGYDQGGYAVDLGAIMREAGEKVLQDGAAQARAAGVEAEGMLLDTFGQRLGEAVAEAAKLWNADLVVAGTHGRRGVSRLLLGSGAEQILRLAPTPVLTIRGGDEPETDARAA